MTLMQHHSCMLKKKNEALNADTRAITALIMTLDYYEMTLRNFSQGKMLTCTSWECTGGILISNTRHMYFVTPHMLHFTSEHDILPQSPLFETTKLLLPGKQGVHLGQEHPADCDQVTVQVHQSHYF